MAVKDLEKGVPITEIAQKYQVDEGTVHRWNRTLKENGGQGLKATTANGASSKFPGLQVIPLIEIIEAGAMEFGFEDDAWTLRRIQQVLFVFGVEYARSESLSRVMHRLGMSPQKPQRRSYERNEEKRKEFLDEVWVIDRERMVKGEVILVFLDESGFKLQPNVVRTWGPVGRTPTFTQSGKRGKSVNSISAVTSSGKLYYRIYEGEKVNGSKIRSFLRFLIGQIPGKRLVIYMDNHPTHHSRRVKELIESPEWNGIAELRFFPPYSPDLNPDENVWGYLKNRLLKNKLILSTKELIQEIKVDMRRMKRPDLIKSFLLQALPWDESSREALHNFSG